MTPEEIALAQEQGKTEAEIAEQQAKDAEAIRVAEEQKAKDALAAKEALLGTLTDAEVEKTEHFRKMAYALREEQRQEKAERQRLAEENQRLTSEAEARNKVVPPEDSEQILTVGEFNKRVDAKVIQLQKDAETRRMKEEAVIIQRTLAESEVKAKAELTEEKMGKGLDYDSVFIAAQRQIQENPAYAQVIFKSKDPAREAYRIGLLDPAIQTLREQYQTEKMLLKIKDGGEPPKGGGGGSASGTPGDLDILDLLNLSPEELAKRTEALEKQGG